MTRDEISKVSAESQKYCTELFDKLVTKGMYTPAGLEPTLMFPGYHGGGNWSSASFGPTSGYLFVNMNEDGAIGQMNPQPPGSPIPYVRRGDLRNTRGFEIRRVVHVSNHPGEL
jgi:glucose dehydrogenase